MEIDFEGKKVTKAKTGYYKCPYKCGDTRYPAKKWKTENGFRKHMSECPMKPSAIAKKEEAENIKNEIFEDRIKTLEFIKEQVLEELGLYIGKTIFYIRRVVVKPTHEQRGHRLVRVRYEEVVKYTAESSIIGSFKFQNPAQDIDIDYAKKLLVINYNVTVDNLCNNLEEAREKALTLTQQNEDWRKKCSEYR